MMELIKRKLIKSVKILILFLIIGCNYDSNKENQPLECILNKYIENYNLAKEDIITINYKSNWTDSTSIAVISYNDFKENKEQKIFSSKYNNIKIYLLINSQKNVLDTSILNSLIPNNLVWRLKKRNKNKKVDYILKDYEELSSIQVVYNTDKKCIQKIIVGPTSLITEIYKNCHACGSLKETR